MRLHGRQNNFLAQLISQFGTSIEKLFENDKNSAEYQIIDRKTGKELTEDEDYTPITQVPVEFPRCSLKSRKCFSRGDPVVCGEPARNGRIVNGTNALPGAYPWTVGLQFVDKLYCGGSLITNRFVLTAAHCLKGINHSRIRLILGDHNRRIKSAHQVTRTIDRVFLHEGFVKKTFNNDIALIRLNAEVEFSPYILPVCLPSLDHTYLNENGTVVGWGKLEEGGSPSDILQEVVVPIISVTKCKHHTKYRSREITENMFCAGYDEGVLDACQGDSGGPMVWKGSQEDSAFTQIGIVSWGQGCARAGYPGVYTRIGRYLNWIIKHVTDNNSCFC